MHLRVSFGFKRADPSGRMLMTCLPLIRDEFCRMSYILTECSDTWPGVAKLSSLTPPASLPKPKTASAAKDAASAIEGAAERTLAG